jgi:predicted alpha/beta hydrolase
MAPHERAAGGDRGGREGHRGARAVSGAALGVTLRASDDRELAGLLLQAPAARGAISLSGAAGYPREFYLRFAGYCAERGYHTLVYDYRGTGASARAPLRADPATMAEWGRLDMPAALAFMAQRFAGLPLVTVGHSVGGQLGPAMQNQALARAHVMLAASIGYWRLELAPFRYAALFFWWLYGPLTLSLLGYVPRSPVWRGHSLPAGVFRQWRTWCTRPAHFGPDLATELAGNQFAECAGPLLAWAFTDDPIANPVTVPALLKFYPRARIEQRWTGPRELGVRRIGHRGFFSERHRATLWRALLDWIDARCA